VGRGGKAELADCGVSSLKLLSVVCTLDPKYGGPAEAAIQQTVAFRKLGHEAEILTLDDPGDPWLQLPGVVALGPSRGRYRFNKRLRPWLKEHVRQYDAVIIGGIWQYHGYAASRACMEMGVPYFLYTHGMLDPWFKAAFPLKHIKKITYWRLFEHKALNRARAVIFTSELEAERAKWTFSPFDCTEVVVPLGIQPPPPDNGLGSKFRERFGLGEAAFLLFLGRLHPKKGCDLLIQALARVPDVQLVMAGPDADGWRAELEALADRNDVARRIVWTGHLDGELKWGALYAADAFILPSHGENFGVAVVEALGCGLPVLITDKINIWQAIDQDGACVVGEDTVLGTADMMVKWQSLSDDEKTDMRQKAKGCFQNNFEVMKVSRRLADKITETIS
jgi:glycosyltransferase involved in cell wall biosynthesis